MNHTTFTAQDIYSAFDQCCSFSNEVCRATINGHFEYFNGLNRGESRTYDFPLIECNRGRLGNICREKIKVAIRRSATDISLYEITATIE
jgi:hypothetical protein